MPCPAGGLEFELDFIRHQLEIRTTDGGLRRVSLAPQTVSEFYTEVKEALEALGAECQIHTMPNELADAIPFPADTVHRTYDADAANRFWRILVEVHRVFHAFRTRFVGKSSPVHFFWGAFDLAVTRFSGRRAPLHPGGIPRLPDAVMQEAYSHEVSSAGFWPGGGAVEYPAFYSYAYPPPEGFAAAPVRPSAAIFNKTLGEFILPYDAVRIAESPDETLLDFLQSTYEAAAILGRWDRPALEVPEGKLGIPRSVA
jgi:hypothetical protein